jgi:hypothetical protein
MPTLTEVTILVRAFDAFSPALRSAERAIHRFDVKMRRAQLRIDLERQGTLPRPLIGLLVRWCPERRLPQYVTYLEG